MQKIQATRSLDVKPVLRQLNRMRRNDPMVTVTNTPKPIALTVAGFDPSSGAGVTADIKTFAAHSVYGVACISALTIQSTQGVKSVQYVDPGTFRATLDCLAQDLTLAGVKLGMLATGETVRSVCDFLDASSVPRRCIVLDPVLRSSSGKSLLDEAGIRVLSEKLIGLAGSITPNLPELSMLTGANVTYPADVPDAACRLQNLAAKAGNYDLNVVVTGGHLGEPHDYVLPPSGKGRWIPGKKIDTASTHGTGCAFSSALLCALIAGIQIEESVIQAKRFVESALRAAYPVGKGNGPLHHLYRLDRKDD
jgi:hydroxymethylpyrimidine/phosphomethylpyrimidine kinase